MVIFVGDITLVNGTHVQPDDRFILKARVTDKGSPVRISQKKATIRLDLFNPDKILAYIDVALPASAVKVSSCYMYVCSK